MGENDDRSIYEAALELFRNVWRRNRPVRLVGVGVSGFDDSGGARQLSLWEAPAETSTDAQLQSTLDDIRKRFGDSAIRRGSDLQD